MLKYLLIILFLLPLSTSAHPYLLVLGTAQDGGYPHIGCQKKCCTRAWSNARNKRYVVSLALIDPQTKKWWLFEATPDIKEQLHLFQKLTGSAYNYLPDGIFITHAHIGHYTGLMQLGREAMGTKHVPVYVLPKMKKFLIHNGPWSQLVALQNITIQPLKADEIIGLPGNIGVKAFTVPHRDEYSETAGFSITTTAKKYLFIPDINKWDKWERNIIDEVTSADVALLDATFYNSAELPGRRMDEVPHPFVQETMQLFSSTPADTRSHIYFIHTNHTNPLLWDTATREQVRSAGYNIAAQGMKL